MKRSFVIGAVAAAAACITFVSQAPPSAAQVGDLDHLLCYRMRDPLSVAAKFDLLARLQPEFSRAGCKLIIDQGEGEARTEFCVPASKRNVDAPGHNPDLGGPPLSSDYVCYRVVCPPNSSRPPDKFVEDQFGRRGVRFAQPVRVCVPARKEPLPCSPAGGPGEPMCGGECPASERCLFDRDTGLCRCAPVECKGKPDAAGMCGGLCPPGTECVATAQGNCRCRPQPGCGFDPTTNQCGGSCPVATEICALDASGACRCQPPPPPECGRDPATGQCGGPCPVAGDVCAPTAAGLCRCQPPPPPECGPDAAGLCAGPCPNGLQCQPIDSGCLCLPPPPQCGPDAAGQCAGPCPVATDVCISDAAGTCRCVPPPPPQCGPDPATGQCGGPCPNPTDVCQVDANGVCGCLPLQLPCQFDPTSNECGGFCPAPLTCAAVSPTACACVPPEVMCGRDPSTGQCGGLCPSGTLCRQQPGTDQCVCTPFNGLAIGKRRLGR